MIGPNRGPHSARQQYEARLRPPNPGLLASASHRTRTVPSDLDSSGPRRRVLWDARMGVGNTNMSLTVLEHQFYDPRKSRDSYEWWTAQATAKNGGLCRKRPCLFSTSSLFLSFLLSPSLCLLSLPCSLSLSPIPWPLDPATHPGPSASRPPGPPGPGSPDTIRYTQSALNPKNLHKSTRARHS